MQVTDNSMMSVSGDGVGRSKDLKLVGIFEEIYAAARLSRNYKVIMMLDELANNRIGSSDAMAGIESIVKKMSER